MYCCCWFAVLFCAKGERCRESQYDRVLVCPPALQLPNTFADVQCADDDAINRSGDEDLQHKSLWLDIHMATDSENIGKYSRIFASTQFWLRFFFSLSSTSCFHCYYFSFLQFCLYFSWMRQEHHSSEHVANGIRYSIDDEKFIICRINRSRPILQQLEVRIRSASFRCSHHHRPTHTHTHTQKDSWLIGETAISDTFKNTRSS